MPLLLSRKICLIGFILCFAAIVHGASEEFRIFPESLVKGSVRSNDQISVRFADTFDLDSLTDYIVLIEKDGQRIKLDQKYSRKDRSILVKPAAPFAPGDRLSVIVKKMSKKGNYFHLVEILKHEFQVEDQGAEAKGTIKKDGTEPGEKRYDRKEAAQPSGQKPASPEMSPVRTPQQQEVELTDDAVITKMKSILGGRAGEEPVHVAEKSRAASDTENTAWYEDTIHVTVWGHEDLSMKVRVDEAGNMNYPLVGTLNVLNMRASTIAKLVKQKLEDGYIREAYVVVDIMKESKRKYSVKVIGHSGKTGILQFDKKPTIIDLISEVGMPVFNKVETWENVIVRIIEKDKVIEKLVSVLLDNIPESMKIILENDTVVYFISNSVVQNVYVLGNVSKPGKYEYYEGMTVLDSLVEAQGTIGQSYAYASSQDHFRANLRQVMVIRKNAEAREVNVLVVNMEAVMFKGKVEYNIKLEPGDWIVVPQRRVRNLYTYVEKFMPILNFISNVDGVVKIFE